MALIGSITNWGEIQGQINDANGVLTGVISSAELLGGEIVGMRGLKGDKGDTGDTGADGQDGADGYSPSASVSKVGDTTTITITDKDGTTTAEVYDGHDGNVFIVELGETTYQEVVDAADDGAIVLLHVEIILTGEKQYYPLVQIYNHRCVFACQRGAEIYFYLLNDNNSWDSQIFGVQETLVSGTNIKTINNTSLLGSGNINIQGGGGSAFVAEYGVTTYADVKDAYDEDAIILCTVDDSGNTAICQLAYYDDENDVFYFAQPVGEGAFVTSIAIDDTWDDGYFYFASTDTATELRNGLMDALDKQKLDGIASGAEVNVQSDWNQSTSTADDYIKNKPTIPSKTSDLNNDSGFITDKGVYIAEYGTTTHSNLCDAIDAEKLIIVSKDGILVPVSAEYAEDYYKWWIYEKPNRDSYGYNKGESDPQYLYNEEYFYDEYYDHWNVSKVYDSTIANSYPSYANLVGSSTIHLYGITDLATFYEYTLNASDIWTATPDSGFIKTETDPVFTASDAYGITSSDITNWDNSYDGKVSLDTSAPSGTDHDLYAAITAFNWEGDVIV